MVASQQALDDLTSWLTLNTLLDLARRSSETYKDLAKNSTEHFLVTPVTALPTGKEQGKFLAIDIGGSNLRVGFVELVGESATSNPAYQRNQDVDKTVKRSFDKSWPIGDHLKMDQPEDLFRWIGDCMAEVVREAVHNNSIVADQEILLGVTFSFPMAYVLRTDPRIVLIPSADRQSFQRPLYCLWGKDLPSLLTSTWARCSSMATPAIARSLAQEQSKTVRYSQVAAAAAAAIPLAVRQHFQAYESLQLLMTQWQLLSHWRTPSRLHHTAGRQWV